MEVSKFIFYLICAIMNILLHIYFFVKLDVVMALFWFPTLLLAINTCYYVYQTIANTTGNANTPSSFKSFANSTGYQICLITSGGLFGSFFMNLYVGIYFGKNITFLFGITNLWRDLQLVLLFVDNCLFRKEQGSKSNGVIVIISFIIMICCALLAVIIGSIFNSISFFDNLWMQLATMWVYFFGGCGAYLLCWKLFNPSGVSTSSGSSASVEYTSYTSHTTTNL